MILKSQFGENPDVSLLPNKSNVKEEVLNVFDENNW